MPTTITTVAIMQLTVINDVERETAVITALTTITPTAFAVRSNAKTSARRFGGASVSRTRD